MKEKKTQETLQRIPLVGSYQSRSQWWTNLGPPRSVPQVARQKYCSQWLVNLEYPEPLPQCWAHLRPPRIPRHLSPSMPVLRPFTPRITDPSKETSSNPLHCEERANQNKNNGQLGHLTENQTSVVIVEKCDRLKKENSNSANNSADVLSQLRVTFPHPCYYHECCWAFHTQDRLTQHVQNFHLCEQPESVSVEEGLQIPLKPLDLSAHPDLVAELEVIEEILLENGFVLPFPRIKAEQQMPFMEQ